MTGFTRRDCVKIILALGLLPLASVPSDAEAIPETLATASELLRREPLRFGVKADGDLWLLNYEPSRDRYTAYDVEPEEIAEGELLWDLLDRIEELRGYVYNFSQELEDEGRWLDDWGTDEVHEFLSTLRPEEDVKLRRELHAWFTQEVSYEEEGGNDIARPIDGRRFAFEFFAYSVDGDLLDALDIGLIEGDQPGSNYRGAELNGSVENALRVVRGRDLPFIFERMEG
ncbi:hypothetical protein LZA78_03895 [Sinirhodobacter sp. WL0062]|uniref:Uncharacterized protein n=1 Tax=Rhodobacter flavimaris TaxID=2907145 RepID=A0ABS8YVT4_9RHOB|nr:hypothetical protein [Sinirhodobacter sp. WL0062]MCE5972618.1 hypothetical protein [Sinirhodobacter sp. WL0062]